MNRQVSYNFDFGGGKTWSYNLEFDQQNKLISKSVSEPKSWTALEFHQCSHCPLKASEHASCPVAKNLDAVVEDSKETVSFTRAKVRINTPERIFAKECATQEALCALFGLIMATSGCPHLDWLRPLARFHLPFANTEETLARVLSFQLLEDYLIGKDHGFKESAENLKKRYLEVEKVNHAFIKRFRSYCEADADKNALSSLDVFVQIFPLHMESNFQPLRKYFEVG